MTCVYCLSTGQLREEQILVRGEQLYICAPRGQIVEGYLIIAPYRCIGCLAHCPPSYFAELAAMSAAVVEFYAKAYGTVDVTLYEQGRAGGGNTNDEVDRFPLHAHLCCLPLAMDLHRRMVRDHMQRPLAGPQELAVVAGPQPYLYIDSRGQRFVYVGRSDHERRELAGKRLKPVIAALAGFPERADWRAYPGDRELAQVIDRWRKHGGFKHFHEAQGDRAQAEAGSGP